VADSLAQRQLAVDEAEKAAEEASRKGPPAPERADPTEAASSSTGAEEALALDREPADRIWGLAGADINAESAPSARCETYGTKVQFVSNPSTAAGQARRDHKLLFVLHLSGNFEDAQFT
jgi:hypothetical protein